MPPGTTFEHLRGFFDAETKTLYVPEYYRPRLQPTRGLVKNDQADAVLRHEVGHAVDRVLGMASDTQEFQRAYRADVDELKDDGLADFAYFWQHRDDARNRREVFAELFADHHGGGPHDDSRRIRHVFSRCDKLIKEKLQEIWG
jgi:hypothetical protein